MPSDRAPQSRLSIVLVQEEHRGTLREVQASVEPSGAFRLSCGDYGAAPQAFRGTEEYEYLVEVSADMKDKLLLALIQERWGGRARAVDEFRDWLSERGIPKQFTVW